MKNNFFSSKKPKKGLIALLLLFCGLFANEAMGQTTYTWITTTGTWENAANWSTTAGITSASTTTTSGSPTVTLSVANANAIVGAGITGTGIPAGTRITAVAGLTLTISTNATANGSVTVTCRVPSATVPGNAATDLVAVTNGGQVTLSSNTTIAKITLSNTTGLVGGSKLTISGSTTTLAVTSSTDADLVVLVGGNIVNNGILNISSTFVSATFGMRCGNVPNIPGSLNTYGYSGSGTLSIDTSTCGATSGGILFNGVSNATGITRARYSMTLTSANTTFNLAADRPTLRINTGVAATTTYPLPVIIAGTGFTRGTEASPVTGSLLSLDAGANVTVNSGVTLTLNSAATNASNGIDIGNSNTVYTTSLTNNGTINILGSTTRNGIKVSTYTFSGTPTINTTIVNGGTINVDINATATYNSNEGPAAFGITSGYGRVNTNQLLTFTNSGTLNLKNSASGTSIGQAIWVTGAGQRTYATFNNTGTITLEGTASNSGSLSTINNNNAGIINSNNSFAGFAAITNNSGGTFNFTSSSAQSNAIVSPTTNSGTINTGAASDLSVVSGVSTASTGVIDPGGSSRRGIANFSTGSTLDINSTLRLQIAADGTAGVNFDRITNSATGGGFNISAAKLDVTSIYTPSVHTTIDIITTNATGTLTGTFLPANISGLTAGWGVVHTNGTAGKVQLVYGTTWTGATSTTWTDASNWNNGVPTATTDVLIGTGTFQPIIASNESIKSLTLNASTTLTVTSGFNLTVTGAVVNNGGTMTIENNANLIQSGTTNTNTGSIIVNRNSNALYRSDYTIWSSPVFDQKLLAFSPLTSITPYIRFYNYNETTNFYSEVATPAITPFTAGAGYLIRMPNTGTANYGAGTETLTFQGIFTGVPNNGDYTKAVTYLDASHGYNMVGNPYPSTINADTFIAANAANIETGLYFWRKTNSVTGSAYAVYNPIGGTTATATAPSSEVPNGIIQVGQGFFVKAKSGATAITFTNAMRVANNANQFFKTKAVQKDRLWLNLTSASGVFGQTLVGYTADATLGVDMYDAKYINDSPVALTTNIASEEYTIQGRPTFDPTDVVALNFKTNATGDYTIALGQFDGAFASGQDVYLLDNNTGAETNLKLGSYTFNTTAGTDNSRFTLKYQKTLKVGENAFNENSVSVYKNNGTIYVNSGEVAISNIKVFDIQGRLVAEQKNVKSTAASIPNLKSKNQVLIVKVSGENNKVVTKKVLN